MCGIWSSPQDHSWAKGEVALDRVEGHGNTCQVIGLTTPKPLLPGVCPAPSSPLLRLLGACGLSGQAGGRCPGAELKGSALVSQICSLFLSHLSGNLYSSRKLFPLGFGLCCCVCLGSCPGTSQSLCHKAVPCLVPRALALLLPQSWTPPFNDCNREAACPISTRATEACLTLVFLIFGCLC